MSESLPAISLHQPWASFIAIGLKPLETRSWPPPAKYIGQRIAIHAAKKAVGAGDREWAAERGVVDMPLGAIVCTAILVGAYRCTMPVEGGYIAPAASVPGSRPIDWIKEDEFGDYARGRWAWHLTHIERFDPPVPARGAQGWWRWERSDG